MMSSTSPVRRLRPEFFHRAAHNRGGGERRQRRFLRRLPHHRVAAHQRERGVPREHRDREIERRDHADDARRAPRLDELVLAPLGLDGQAVELARKPQGEVADIDHLLDFAKTLGFDLADLEGDETAELRFSGAQLFADEPHQLAAPRRRDAAPRLKRFLRATNRCGGFIESRLPHPRDRRAVNR